jgi:hypothetical protein
MDPRPPDPARRAHRTRPIEAYGLIGDTRTAALVSDAGAIDWMCVPRFDGGPLFGRLLGGSAAGTFQVRPLEGRAPSRRRYEPDSATLTTTWDTSSGRLTLADGMVAEIAGRLLPTNLLIRRLSAQGASLPSWTSILGWAPPSDGRAGNAEGTWWSAAGDRRRSGSGLPPTWPSNRAAPGRSWWNRDVR